jgi:hypothetical protein
MANSSPTLYALLIGIDCYMPNRLSDGSLYKNLLAAIGGEQPVTRKLTVAASPSRDWTTQQLMLTITK